MCSLSGEELCPLQGHVDATPPFAQAVLLGMPFPAPLYRRHLLMETLLGPSSSGQPVLASEAECILPTPH